MAYHKCQLCNIISIFNGAKTHTERKRFKATVIIEKDVNYSN